jgi:hypothetical protein
MKPHVLVAPVRRLAGLCRAAVTVTNPSIKGMITIAIKP